MPFITNSENDRKKMLKTIGIQSFDQLISNIPQEIRFNGQLDLPNPLAELEIDQLMQKMASQNTLAVSFLGGGVYDHYIPAIVDDLSSRPEFYTSYTPYQPEVSQGNLQTMYEFQSMVCELTQMDVTNASTYEGASALAEAVLLAAGHTRKNKVLLPAALNPHYLHVVQTYVANMDIELVTVPAEAFVTDMKKLSALIDEDTAAVVIQHPNYFGYLEDVHALSNMLADKKALLIAVYDPISLGLLAPPGDFGADIAVAEGQSLGNAQNFGGPFIGLFSTTEKLVRKIPGRLSGVTVDTEGKRGFVLTLQTREQHIRREKATSNICTNSGLMAVRSAIYLATVGKEGIKEIANLALQKAHYLAEQLSAIPGISLANEQAAFFKEFTVTLPKAAQQVVSDALNENIFAGIPLTHMGYNEHLLIAVTEKRTREELDLFVSVLKKILK